MSPQLGEMFRVDAKFEFSFDSHINWMLAIYA